MNNYVLQQILINFIIYIGTVLAGTSNLQILLSNWDYILYVNQSGPDAVTNVPKLWHEPRTNTK